jgi:threonylcarbamoyladenosine tRNA methylthiotransferase MtaB
MKVFLDTVGCKLNQSEIERFSVQFHEAGHELVASMDQADVVVVNTCAVTAAAASDSRQKLRQALRKNPNVRLIATGCLASLHESLAEAIPGLSDVIPNDRKDTLVEDLFGEIPEHVDVLRLPVAGERSRTRAFIKAQDGCNHYCTFCITRIARGKSRSIPAEQVVEDIQRAVRAGVKEIVLTGVQLGSWGLDHQPVQKLADLIRLVLTSLPSDVRVRISSIEPWDVDEDLISLWADQRLCPHFHLPLQSGSDKILRLMARKTSIEDYASLVGMIRRHIPDAAITTDMIAGFPGETVEDFTETLRFIEQIQFAGGHAFSYSARQGTPAARLPGQLDGIEKHRRSRLLIGAFESSAEQYRQRWLGKTVDVLWESARRDGEGWLLSGWTREYLRVEASSPTREWNQICRVKIHSITGDICSGERE